MDDGIDAVEPKQGGGLWTQAHLPAEIDSYGDQVEARQALAHKDLLAQRRPVTRE